MIPRRKALRATLVGSFAALAVTRDAEAGQAAAQSSRSDDENVTRIVAALHGIREEIAQARQFVEIAVIREAQKTFLRANGKFPDYIEVGADVWFAVQDWHVRWQQPLSIERDALGRYIILLSGTAVVMRPDVTVAFVGLPYDAK